MIKIINHRIESHGEPIPDVPLGSARLIFADPPYDYGVAYADDPTGDHLGLARYRDWCAGVVCSLYQHLRPGGMFFWLCPAEHMDFIPMILGRYGICQYRIVKQETFAQYNQHGLTKDYRMLFGYQKPGSPLVFNPDAIREKSKRQELGDKRADPRGRVPGLVWNIRRLQGTSNDRVEWHPAQLPPEILDRIVLGWSNPGDTVLDAFAGSGNMGLVCHRHGRNAVLIEGSPTYCNLMAERLKFCGLEGR